LASLTFQKHIVFEEKETDFFRNKNILQSRNLITRIIWGWRAPKLDCARVEEMPKNFSMVVNARKGLFLFQVCISVICNPLRAKGVTVYRLLFVSRDVVFELFFSTYMRAMFCFLPCVNNSIVIFPFSCI
jgi:hypothetical protein